MRRGVLCYRVKANIFSSLSNDLYYNFAKTLNDFVCFVFIFTLIVKVTLHCISYNAYQKMGITIESDKSDVIKVSSFFS